MITNTEQKMKHTRLAVCILFAASLAACGGGGGGSTPVVTPPVAAAPTATVTLSTVKAKAGDNVVVTWSSTDATSCVGSDALSTSATSGTSAVSAAVGQTKFTLTCTGPGGNKVASATLGVPLPVLASSYANKMAAAKALGQQTAPAEVTESNTLAFADFFQDGSYSMVTHSLEYNYSAANVTKFGHIKFYKNVNGAWVDNTDKLLSSTVGCLHPRKAIVADFNGDGKPDVFFACHGLDVDPFPGEQQHVLMSQPDNTYRNITLAETCYCHSASAADATGNGFADILVTDNMISHTPYFLTNKAGVLTKDTTRFGQLLSSPSDGSVGLPGVSYGTPAIYTAELIDFYGTGRYDAFLAGTSPDNVSGNWAPSIFKNDGSGVYTQANSEKLPYDKFYDVTLDIVFKNGTVYLTSAHANNGQGPTYGFSNIAKIDLSKKTYTQVYANNANFTNGHGWLNWIIPVNDTIQSMIAQYGVVVKD